MSWHTRQSTNLILAGYSIEVEVSIVCNYNESGQVPISSTSAGLVSGMTGFLLSQVDTVVFDKTGTLTQGKLQLVSAAPANGVAEPELLRWAAAAESSARHPLADAVLAAAESAGVEIPGSRDASTEPGAGVCATVDGRRHALLNNDNARYFMCSWACQSNGGRYQSQKEHWWMNLSLPALQSVCWTAGVGDAAAGKLARRRQWVSCPSLGAAEQQCSHIDQSSRVRLCTFHGLG